MKRFKSTQKKEELIIKLYCEDLMSTTKIAKIFNCAHSTINNILIRNSIDRRDIFARMDRKKINKDYFKKIDNPKKAYFLGLLYADGCNFRKGISLSLQERDKYLVYAFRDQICSETFKIILRPKKQQNHQNSFMCSIGSIELSNDLSILGCIPKKSLILDFPTKDQVPENLLSHFVRGYFDGDGCITTKNKSGLIQIAGTKKFNEKLKNIMLKIGVNFGIIQVNKIFIASSGGTQNLFKFYKYLYKDAEIFMKRKKDKFDNLFKLINLDFNTGRICKTGYSSKFRGVIVRIKNGKSRIECHLKHKGKAIYLGVFNSEEEAAKAYDKKIFELRGKKSVLNFPENYDTFISNLLKT